MAQLSTSQPFQFLIPPHLLGQALYPSQTGITPKLSLERTMPEDSVNCRLLLVKRYE